MSNRTYALMSLPYPVMLTETGRRTEAIFTTITTETSGGFTAGAGPIYLPDKSVSQDNIILGRYRKSRILGLPN